MSNKMKNYGMLLMDYFNGEKEIYQVMKRDDGKVAKIPMSLFFRTYEELLPGERNFLKYCKGDVLCIGGGTGVHSLIMQENGLDVLAIDISEEACEIMKKRGVKKVKCADFYEFNGGQFNTIVLLGRNIGMVGTLDKLKDFLIRIKGFMTDDCNILVNSFDLKESSDIYDIKYMQMNRDAERYYGEARYCTIYNDIEGEIFKWLYLDFNTLHEYASEAGLNCKMIEKDDMGNYLALINME